MLVSRFCISRMGRTGEVGGVTRRVFCTWWLLGLAVKVPWLGPSEPILALAAWTDVESATVTTGNLGSGRVLDNREY